MEADHCKFLYDGFNLVGEFDDNSGIAPIRTYTWGLDLSGTIQGAGGVGGLVGIEDHAGGQTYLPTNDGNGNVVALVDASDGSIAAEYEYGPYGEPLRATGPYAEQNPFRFSTKYLDTETGLNYYGFRYYTPELGRFLNRDPLGESGGANLYGFVGNNPVNNWDYLGLCDEAADYSVLESSNNCGGATFSEIETGGSEYQDFVLATIEYWNWVNALSEHTGVAVEVIIIAANNHDVAMLQAAIEAAQSQNTAPPDTTGEDGDTVAPGVLTPSTEVPNTSEQCACAGPVNGTVTDPNNNFFGFHASPDNPNYQGSDTTQDPGGSGTTQIVGGGGNGDGGNDGNGSIDDNGNSDDGSGGGSILDDVSGGSRGRETIRSSGSESTIEEREPEFNPEVFLAIDFEAIGIVGIEVTAGVVLNLKDILESGVFAASGEGAGANVGLAIAVGGAIRGVEGKNINIDANINVPTPTISFDQHGAFRYFSWIGKRLRTVDTWIQWKKVFDSRIYLRP